MHTLLFMRHAKSSWKEPYKSDAERPLNKRGKADAPKMGNRLKAKKYTFDSIISSPAKRALQTAESIADALDFSDDIIKKPALYLADIDSYMEVLSGLSEDVKHVIIVSHNPGTEDIVEYLCGQYFRIPTAAYVHLEFNKKWSQLGEMSCKTLDYDFPKSERSI